MYKIKITTHNCIRGDITMKRLRLKSWVVAAIYMVGLVAAFAGVYYFGNKMLSEYEVAVDVDYVPDSIVENETMTVVEVTNETVNHPYLLESVTIAKDFYDSSLSEENQLKSLIYYKNTYMENTGILYTDQQEFDVVSVLEGTVSSIVNDDILGNVVEITHTTDLVTIYHCLNNVNVNVGDIVGQNQVIGTSGKVNVDKGYENALLFEVNYRGQIINPSEFYNMKISELLSR